METHMNEVEMEVFRAGDYGAKGRYSEADLQMLAEDYRPELLEAPLTFDHAQSGPAYGWVTAIRANGDRLMAVLRGVPECVRQLVRSGAFKSRSVELIRQMNETDRPYLRAVSLLGAATPQVKGLSEIRFSASEDSLASAEIEMPAVDQVESSAGEHEQRDEAKEIAISDLLASTDEPDGTVIQECSVEETKEGGLPNPPRTADEAECARIQPSTELAQEKPYVDDPSQFAAECSAECPTQTTAACEKPLIPQIVAEHVGVPLQCDGALDSQECLSCSGASLADSPQPTPSADDELHQLREQVLQLQRELRGQRADALFVELRSEGCALPERHVAALRQFARACDDSVIRFSETENVPVIDWLRDFLRATAPRVPIGIGAGRSGDAAGTTTAVSADVELHFSERTDPESIDLHRRAVTLMQTDPQLAYSAALSRVAAV